MALPVSCASTRRCNWADGPFDDQPHRRAIRNAQRIHRNRAPRRQRHALGSARTESGLELGQGLLAEEHGARIAPQHVVDALRIERNPVADARPRRIAHQLLVEQPATDADIGLVVGGGIGQPHGTLLAVGLEHLQPPGTLDLQQQGIHRIGQPGDLLTAQRRLGLRQRFHLLARVPGLARSQALRRPVQRYRKLRPWQARGLQHRFEIGREHAVGDLLRRRLDPVGLQSPRHPVALLDAVGQAQQPDLRAQGWRTRARGAHSS